LASVALTLVALLVGAACGLFFGGDLRHVATWQVRSWWLLIPGLGLQVAADRLALGALGTVALAAGYVCLLVLALRNAVLMGTGIVALGLACNLLVVTVDGGMPVRASAIAVAGIATEAQAPALDYGHRHHLETPADHLRFLDDAVPIAAAHEVASVGDLILAMGIGDMTMNLVRRPRHRRGGYRPAHARSRGGRRPSAIARAAIDRLQVAVEAVEHGARDRLPLGAPGGDPPPLFAAQAIPQDHQHPGTEVVGQRVHRLRLVGHREAELAQGGEGGLGDLDETAPAGVAHRAPPLVGQVDLDPLVGAGAGRGADCGQQLHPQ
jgi:hypothetical protein